MPFEAAVQYKRSTDVDDTDHSSWRIYDPKTFPLHTYYKSGDIVDEMKDNGKFSTPIGRGRILSQFNDTFRAESTLHTPCNRSDNVNHSHIDTTNIKRRRLSEQQPQAKFWNVEMIDSSTSSVLVVDDRNKEKKDFNKIICTDKIQLVLGGHEQRNGVEVIITSTTDNFRKVANKISDIRANDRIIEIGCSTGETSHLLWQRLSDSKQCTRTSNSLWIGFDTSKLMIEKMKARIEETSDQFRSSGLFRSCICMNILSNPGAGLDSIANCSFLSEASNERRNISPTIAFLDIGGNREEYTVLRMLSWLLNEPSWKQNLRLIVVKSKEVTSILCSNSSTNNNNGICDPLTGSVQNGDTWLQSRLHMLQKKYKNDKDRPVRLNLDLPKHPLQAPKRYRPLTIVNKNNDNSINGEKVLICRYHNYHVQGCKRFQDVTVGCPYDHEYCHWCLQKGHIARFCPTTSNNGD